MTHDTPEGFQVELPISWHVEAVPEEPVAAAAPAPRQVKGPKTATPIAVEFDAKWGVSTKPAWYKWYKVVGRDPEGTKDQSTYTQMAAARSLDELAKVLQDGRGMYPIDWVVEHIYEWSGKTFGGTAPPPKHPLWKEVDFRSVSGFLESFLATGSYGHSQVTVYADAFVKNFKVHEGVAEDEWEAPAPKDAHYASAEAGTFIRDLELTDGSSATGAFGTPSLGQVDSDCGCSPLPTVVYLHQDLGLTSVLGMFLFRNGLALPDLLPLSYRQSSKSWLYQTHFKAEEEQWDVVAEWRCSPALGQIGGSNDSWWLSLTLRRRLEGTTRVTRFLIPVPESSSCAAGSLSVRMYIDPATLLVTNENGIPLLNTLVEDGIRMLDNATSGRLLLWVMDRAAAASETGQFSLAPYLPENVR